MTASIPGRSCCRRKTPISDDDTLGSVYFDRLFPMGVEAMLEAVDLVKAGKAPKMRRTSAQATYEAGAPRGRAHRLGRSRGARPQLCPRLQPGAGRLDDARRQEAPDLRDQEVPAADPKGIGGAMGPVMEADGEGFTVACADGRFKVTRVQADGPKVGAGEWAKRLPTSTGARLT